MAVPADLVVRSRPPWEAQIARHQKLLRQTVQLASKPALNFFELATSVAALHERDPALLQELLEQTAIKRRRLYYFLEIGRLIREHNINKADAEEVGWTKLQIVARHLNYGGGRPEDLHEYLKMAKTRDARSRSLTDVLAGRKVSEDQAVQFILGDKDKAELDQTLIAFGAKQVGRGLAQREAALLRILRAAMVSRETR